MPNEDPDDAGVRPIRESTYGFFPENATNYRIQRIMCEVAWQKRARGTGVETISHKPDEPAPGTALWGGMGRQDGVACAD